MVHMFFTGLSVGGGMRASRVVTAFALVSLVGASIMLLQPPQAGNTEWPAVVARLPQEGDTAQYRFVGDAVDVCSDTSALVELHDRLQWRWTATGRIVWDGSVQRFQALEAMWESRHCAEPGGAWWAVQEADLYTQLPGARVAHTTQVVGLSRMPMPSYYLDDILDELTYDVGPCHGPPVGLVLGLAADAALRALSNCAGQGVFPDGPASAEWFNEPEFGVTWVVDIGVAGSDEFRIRYAPTVSMPVEIQWSSQQHGSGHLVMTGWQDGSTDIPTSLPTVDLPSRLEAVAWGPTGPIDDDLYLFPLEDAKAAAEQTRTGETYFAMHPQAGVARVSFWADWQSPDPPTDGDSDGERAVGVMLPQAECSRTQGAPIDELSRPPAGAQHRFLDVTWADSALAMQAGIRSAGAPYEVGLTGAAAADEEPSLRSPELPGLAEGPAWGDLLEAEAFVAAMGGEGRLRIDVDQAPLSADRLGPPGGLAPTADVTTLAAVRLYECGVRGDVNTGFHEHGLTFSDGTIQAHWSYEAEYTQTALRNAGLSDPPLWEPPELASLPSDRDWPRQVGLAVGAVAALTLLARFLVGLFTRFDAEDLIEHPTRRALFDAVRDRPGIPLPEVMAEQGLTRAQGRHHVRMLEQSGHIETVRTWRGLVLYPAGHPGTRTADVMNLAHATELLELVKQRPGIHVTGVSERLGLPKARVSHVANSLEAAGLVRRVRAGRRVTLHAA